MLTLDQETADFIAAKAVQKTIALYPTYHRATVAETVRALTAEAKLDPTVASYITHNLERFSPLPMPLSVGAKWHVEAEVLAESAHPFAITDTEGTSDNFPSPSA